jgi:hypothetical protein
MTADLFMHLGVSYSVLTGGVGRPLFLSQPGSPQSKVPRRAKSAQIDLARAYARFLKRREAALIAHTYRVLRPSYGRTA